MNEKPYGEAISISAEIDIGTLNAYIYQNWAVVLEIEAADFFEREDPPSVVLYADLYRGGALFGRVDIVTRIEIRGRELWLTDLHMHGLDGGRARPRRLETRWRMRRWRMRMSKRSSLEEALARRVSVEGAPRNRSGSAVALMLRADRSEGMPRPVDMVRLLTRNGLSLRKAHDILNRLAKGETVPVELPIVTDLAALGPELRSLGVHGLRRTEPELVDIPLLRTRLGLTQREFAVRYGFELGTLRNWEQHRSEPDRHTRLLLRVLDRHTEVVEAVLEDSADS
jgi:DNA-binding transcriptional regulator YiaG